jgi:hypothetical protein
MILEEAIAKHKTDSKYTHPAVMRAVLAASRQAKRIMFDADSCRLLGKFIAQCTDLIVAHRQFAMPPYDVMYMEIDAQAFYDDFPGVAAGPVKLRDPEADQRVGFLFDHRFVFTIAHGIKSTSIMPIFNYINPRGEYKAPSLHKDCVGYQLLPDTTEELTGDYKKLAEAGFDLDLQAKLALMFGSRWATLGIDYVEATKLSAEVQYYYGMDMPVTRLSTEGHRSMLTEIVGDVRNIYGVLLWLNSLPHTIKYTNAPAGHRIMKGKRVALSAHNIVHIHLHGTVQVRNLFAKAVKGREHPRRHDVRGFWRHRGGLPQGCGHIWPETPDKRNKYVCKKCQRERWWVHAHQRGDKDKGFVTKEYVAEI